MNPTNYTIRIDKQLKADATNLFDDLGIGLAGAITMFLKQAVREQRIPFEVFREPTESTLKAIKESEEIVENPSNHKHYANAQEMIDDILK
ncbi:MAG: type II toxin-antitoxin system RelB/DinJ family antitoxin [Bacilli bacterium]|nr:type II toxin-antitoxin system RelB/DinJ family antitoxin [Bacilli bacterium]